MGALGRCKGYVLQTNDGARNEHWWLGPKGCRGVNV